MTNSLSEAMPIENQAEFPRRELPSVFYCHSRLKLFFLRNGQRTDFAPSRLQSSELGSAILSNLHNSTVLLISLALISLAVTMISFSNRCTKMPPSASAFLCYGVGITA